MPWENSNNNNKNTKKKSKKMKKFKFKILNKTKKNSHIPDQQIKILQFKFHIKSRIIKIP